MTIRRNAARMTGLGLLVGAALLVTASCGGDDFGVSCSAELESCPSDEVCWPTAEGFACVDAPTDGGFNGAPCTIHLDAATCAHGFMCYALQGSDPSTHRCSPRCDDTTVCPDATALCKGLYLPAVEASIRVCEPP